MAKKLDKKKAERKIKEALKILGVLGLPRQQQNERSALTLLSLLNLKPADAWEVASDPLMGITPMMEFFAEHYGRQYAPNTRETVRRQTVHQFVQAGLIVPNPDKPSRPTNSPKAVYQIEPSALKLLREFGRPPWGRHLQEYLRTVETLKKLYARERDIRRIPVKLANDQEIRLSPGGQNVLVQTSTISRTIGAITTDNHKAMHINWTNDVAINCNLIRKSKESLLFLEFMYLLW